MADTFLQKYTDTITAPAIGSIPINYAAADQTWATYGVQRGLLISTAGTLKVTWANGLVDTLVLAVGLYPFQLERIWMTGSSTAAGNVLF